MEEGSGQNLEGAEGTVNEFLHKHTELFSGFVEDVKANVLGAASAQSVGPEGLLENIQAFRHAVDWEEWWIRGILAFHAALFIFFIVTRKHFGSQVGLFAVILVGARASELINEYLGDRWETFARQNYFDEHGVFMSVMWAGPLLLLGFIMLINFLSQAATLLVQVKAEQFKREIAAKNAAGKGKPKGGVKNKDE